MEKVLDKKEIENIAKIVHEANKAYCETLGDTSQVSWDEAPENIKQSAINGVQYRLENPNITDKEMHDNWVNFKRIDGWVYGKVKDPKKKTHPCLVPYDKLPESEKIKDALLKAIVGIFK